MRGLLTKSTRELTHEDLVRARIGRNHWYATLDQVPDECLHKDRVSRYVGEIYSTLKRGIGLYLYGDYGRGKTALAGVCLKACMAHGGTSLMLRGMELKDAIIDKPAFDDNETLNQRMLAVDLLAIDDPERGGDSTWSRSCLEEVVRARTDAKQSTILATNLGPAQLKEFLGSGLFHVIRECMVPVEVVGKDWRESVSSTLHQEFSG